MHIARRNKSARRKAALRHKWQKQRLRHAGRLKKRRNHGRLVVKTAGT